MKSILLERYQRLINESVNNDYTDNYDYYRFGPLAPRSSAKPRHTPSSLAELKSIIRNVLSRTKRMLLNTIRTSPPPLTEAEKAEYWIKPNIERFQWLYDHLDDEDSKTLLVSILAFRALGHRRVRLPLNTPEFWETRTQIKALREGVETMDTGFRGGHVYRTDLQSFGYPFELFLRGIQTQFQLQQYRCPLDGDAIEATSGDVVVDAGGGHGDTAVYFAFKSGPEGHVYSFEFLPENVAIFNRNLQINPDYAKSITLVQHPLWSTSDEELFIEGCGPGTCVRPFSSDPSAIKIKTLSIDRLVEREGLDRIDLIKMDIEGAELPALKGAEQSIRRFRPKLAISVYHQLQDFWEIPQWIDSLGLGYRFHLRHFTIHQEETVLFARAPR